MEVVVSGSPMKESSKKEPDKWEIDNWCRTLIEAEEIKADPEKMKYVRPQLQQKVTAIKNLDDLRTIAKKKKEAEGGDE